MTFQEYKSRKEKLDNAIIRWMMQQQPDSIQIEKVIRRAKIVKGKWWDQIVDDAAALILNRIMGK